MQLELEQVDPLHSCDVCRNDAPQPTGTIRCPVVSKFEGFRSAARRELCRFRLLDGEDALERLIAEVVHLMGLLRGDRQPSDELPLRTYSMAQVVYQEKMRIKAKATWQPKEA
jgi:hypothetical protein